jgi:hypothetical protein
MTAIASHLLTENLISLIEAARRLPPGRGGRPVSFGCVLRWITQGIVGPDGRRIRLEGIRLGARWLTSTEALARWAEQLTPRLDPEPGLAPRTPAKRRKAAERVDQVLKRLGM